MNSREQAGPAKGRLVLFFALRFSPRPQSAHGEKSTQRGMGELPFASGTKAPARIQVKKPLHNFPPAAQAKSVGSLPQANECSAQRIEIRIGFERQQSFQFAVGNSAVSEGLSGPFQLVRLPQVFKKVGNYNEPHGTFTSLHFILSVTVPLHYKLRFPVLMSR